MKLKFVAHLPEAKSLIEAMLSPESSKRPSICAVLSHPFWWSADTKLAFLVQLSDRVEKEDQSSNLTLLAALEACSTEAAGGKWGQKIDQQLLGDVQKYRRYNTSSLRDLLRVIRNKYNHFDELCPELKEQL